MNQEIMFVVILFVLSFNIPTIRGVTQSVKCCRADQDFIEENSNFECVERKHDGRIQANFSANDFINSQNGTGKCIEFYSPENRTAYFLIDKTNNMKILKEEDFDPFPKCCPLGKSYNTQLHSCENDNGNLSNIFITIGLPHCEIIFDRLFSEEYFYNFKRDDLGIHFPDDKKIIPERKYCIDLTTDHKTVIRTCEDIQICERIRCIRKCCPDGQNYINGSNCYDTFKNGVNLNVSTRIEDPDEPFAIIHGIHKPIYALSEKKYYFKLNRQGVLETYMNLTDEYVNREISDESYCIEYTKKGKINGYMMFGKSIEQKLEAKFAVTRIVKIISCVFLLFTIIIYLILPRMRNLFGKIVLSYSSATFACFLFLSISQFTKLNDNACVLIGYFSFLTSMMSFTWLHIMCIDIWFSFGTPRTLAGPLQKNELKRLFQYSLFGWGFPTAWVLMTYFFIAENVLPEVIQPYIGKKKCYLENGDARPGNYAFFLFQTLPLLIQQIINTALFIKTILYCLRIKNEVEKMNDARRKTDYNASKERLHLIMKLAVIMGVSFIFETVSSIYNFRHNQITTYIEVIFDTINCLQGVFIFIVFVCKKKVYNSLCEKLSCLNTRKFSVTSTTTTHLSMQQIGNKTSA